MALFLLWLANAATAFAQSSQVTIKAVGAATLGTDVTHTALVGGGVIVEPTELLQFFAEASLEPWHSYPADTQAPPSSLANVGVPFAVIIVNTPLGMDRVRVNTTYFGGLRLITPRDRTVRTFVDVGIGVATFKTARMSYPDFLPSGYYTENLSIWGAGGGLSTTLHERWVLDGEYRWCHPWAEITGSNFHRLQVGLGFTF
ncbi:MAG: outer membrane beta-barrel protein [Vicinamibacterales bacterium]